MVAILDAYVKGTHVWLGDGEGGWVGAQLLAKQVWPSENRAQFEIEDDTGMRHRLVLSISDLSKNDVNILPPLRNPPHLESTDDLTRLAYLNEPSILHTIQTRYAEGNIYTYSGIVLIAVNPFEHVKLYESDMVHAYSGGKREDLPPHLFAIAEDAYRCMIREDKNQTIIVSGESGAGKTVSAKYIMRYFATAENHGKARSIQKISIKAERDSSGMTKVEEQILATNPIMEAFGNAKTTRNDNSSRFGKFIEIQFDKDANIIGAKIKTYLLERSRLVYQPEFERNYHVFYQLCAGATPDEKEIFHLSTYNHFYYLNQGGVGTISGVDDAYEFQVTRHALSTIGISLELQHSIFQLLAALLHVGNIQIGGRGEASVSEDDSHLIHAAQLLGVDAGEFRRWIVRRQIATRSERIVTNLQPAQAMVVRDSVVKYVYAHVFEWLVLVVNESLAEHHRRGGDRAKSFIGVLDIYGFEHFKKNSFEQLCINYANEKLQQEFNQRVLRLEQEEYIRENIDWTMIEYSDNEPCLEMIEGKLGILSLLDEESRMPSGSDHSLCMKLYQQFNLPSHARYFQKPRFSGNAFTISHYAYDVTYDAEGFLEKNRDTLPEEHLAMLQATKFEFLREVLSKTISSTSPTDSSSKRASIALKKPTLSSIFKASLIGLMDAIRATNVHYVRCVKPNEQKSAWNFNPVMVLDQLRACGVLETVRISCAGYPVRWTFEEFTDRFYMFLPPEQRSRDMQESLSRILDATGLRKDGQYQLGSTKIFFRSHQIAMLEGRRVELLNSKATIIQKNVLAFLARRRFVLMRELALRLQCVARRRSAQKRLVLVKINFAATTIQRIWRGYTAWKRYTGIRRATIQLQAAARRWIQRRHYSIMRRVRAAIIIQTAYRAWAARRNYARTQGRLIEPAAQKQTSQRVCRTNEGVLSAQRYREASERRRRRLQSDQLDIQRMMVNSNGRLESRVRSWIDKCERVERAYRATEEAYNIASPRSSRSDFAHYNNRRPDTPDSISSVDTSASLLDMALGAHDEELVRLTVELQRKERELARLQQLLPPHQDLSTRPRSLVNGDGTVEGMMRLRKDITRLKAELSISGYRRRHARASDLASARPSVPTLSSPNSELTGFSHCQARKSASNNKQQLSRRHTVVHPIHKVGELITPSLSLVTHTSVRRASISSIPINAVLLSPASTGRHDPAFLALKYWIRDGFAQLRDDILNLVRTPYCISASSESSNLPQLLFPVHVIAKCVTRLWLLGYEEYAQMLLNDTTVAIKEECLRKRGKEAILVNVYWLRNVLELHSLAGSSQTPMFPAAKRELRRLVTRVYSILVIALKRWLQPYVIPAVVESQSFIHIDKGRSTGAITNSSNTKSSQATMDDFLESLEWMWQMIRKFFLDAVARQLCDEILGLVGVCTFNDVIKREGFCSWKRAMQIQTNIQRLVAWCRSHGIGTAAGHLEHVTQAAKMLQLKMVTLDDIKIISDVCWALSPAQIFRLAVNYHAEDYEKPVGREILEALKARVLPGDAVLLPAVSAECLVVPFEVPEMTTHLSHEAESEEEEVEVIMKGLRNVGKLFFLWRMIRPQKEDHAVTRTGWNGNISVEVNGEKKLGR
ncbi:uncharacterized protein VTP21DRAFT_7489 [Calcarisporiella thermophila]|uniref:uncharacterized protein n=1 Tax=Calcarisporiella thermophila TaxID=911321 RepID=UPI0037421752